MQRALSSKVPDFYSCKDSNSPPEEGNSINAKVFLFPSRGGVDVRKADGRGGSAMVFHNKSFVWEFFSVAIIAIILIHPARLWRAPLHRRGILLMQRFSYYPPMEGNSN